MVRAVWSAATCFGAAVTLAAPALADECLEDLAAVDSENVGIRQHLSDQELRGYTTLRQAARFLMQNEREDACEELVETYNEMVLERREELVDEGLMVDLDEQQRIDQLTSAPMVSELDRPLSAGNIIGSDLRNFRNVDLGDITDIVIGPESGDITHVLVESGGFLGLGEDIVAVPLPSLRIADNGNTFVLDMAEERFEEAPEVETDNITDEGWLDQNDSYYTSAQ